MITRVKTIKEVEAMRTGGKILAEVLTLLKNSTQAGMSTKDLANMADVEVKRLGAKSAIIGYQGFPDVICISVNNQVVHGIPRQSKTLAEGDIVSLDFCVLYDGLITDAAISYILGAPKKPSHKKLVEVTALSLNAGINVLHDGVRVGDIGFAIGNVLASHNYGIVRDLVGHGVGHHMHEEPNIENYGRRGTGMKLQAGMTIAIEPMSTLGGYEVVVDNDGWTILTADNSLSAHFEHTVLITDNGAEILTAV